MDIAGLTFARPEALLLLLLLVPLTVYLSRTSMALLRRGTRRFSLSLRLLIIALLVLALAGTGIVSASNHLSVVFLVDRSDSVSPDQQALQSRYVRDSIAGMGQDDSAGVIAFGADALVDRPVLPDKSPPDLASAPGTTYSNISDALRLALAISQAGSARRIVLLSDGKENVGSAEWAARLAAAHGVAVDVVPLSGKSGPEVWIDGLKAPSPVRENEHVSLQVSISSSTETTATLQISLDGSPINSQEVWLARGANTFVQNLPVAVRGFHTYTAQVVPASGADTRRENNRYSAFSNVLGKSRLLIVEGHTGEAAALKSALAPSMDADLVAPGSMPPDIRSLAGYDGVALVNVPASSLSTRGMEALQVAVHDLGKGLLVLGGDESYAAGGYFRTPLEAMLPVDLNLPSKLDIPSVGMVLVIDRSGSMEEGHSAGGGVKKIELAKEAASRAVAQLSPKDYAGVIVFDDAANWVVPLQSLGDPAQFKSRIGGITSGGGTNIYAGLAPAVDALIASKAKSKHIVLLTDGVSAPGDYDGLLKKMSENAVTLSTVAVGADADTALMKNLALAGKGRYYYTEEGNALPEIFAHESHLAARSYLIEHPFTPERTSPSQILEGIGGLPQLQGYVGTSPRAGGQVALVSDAGDPLLAQWQYGLGRVVAWTSDARGQWAKDWVPWQDFPRFWAQAARWSTGAESSGALQPRVSVESGTAHLTVEAAAPDGSFLDNLASSAVIVSPSLVTSTIRLAQSAPGRYEGEFPATEEGAYLLQVQAAGQGLGKATQTMGLVVPYSPEYRGAGTDNGLMARLAGVTGGRVLDPGDVAAPFEHNLAAARSVNDIWTWLLLLAVLLLPLDIGARRIALSRADLSRVADQVRGRIGWPRVPVPVASRVSNPGMTALFTARDRARELAGPVSPGAPSPEEPVPLSWARDLQLPGRTGRSTPILPGEPSTARAVLNEAEEAEDSLAARLRRAREQRL